MRKFWTFRAAASTADGGADQPAPAAGELLLYGPISESSWWGDEVTPKQFRDDLAALGDIAELRVFVNSPGGDTFAAQTIHSMLVRHPAHVTVHVDGLAASAASLVAMAGDTVVMPRNAMMMIHNPWTIAMGDAREFRAMADTLDSVRESMVAAYEGKTRMARSEIIRLLNAETWMTAEEAVDLGFADEIEQAKQVSASLVRPGVLAINGQEFDLSPYRYRHTPTFSGRSQRDAGAPPERTKRGFERALRDAGLSRTEALAMAAQWYPNPTPADPPRDAAPQAGSENPGRSRTETERLRSETDRLLARVGREFAGRETK